MMTHEGLHTLFSTERRHSPPPARSKDATANSDPRAKSAPAKALSKIIAKPPADSESFSDGSAS